MTINSRQKGNEGERDAARALNRTFPWANAHRGRQYQGSPDSPDVKSMIHGVHLEVKRVERFSLFPALDQTIDDCEPSDTPVVLHRRNRKPWVAIVPLTELPRLAHILAEGDRKWRESQAMAATPTSGAEATPQE